MNPNNVAKARTARLVAEATTPVYTTRTGEPTKWVKADQEMRAWWSQEQSDYYDCRCGDC